MNAHGPPGFQGIQQALAATGNPGDASEVHGTLCALLCLDGELTAAAWLQHLAGEAANGLAFPVQARGALVALFETTADGLRDSDMGFYPLLPGDEHSLARRADALGRWCEGFLSGLGLAGIGAASALRPQVREFLGDVAELSRAGFDAAHSDDEEEEAYVEIVEYLRMGVLLLRYELRPAGPRTPSPRLH